MTTGTLVDFEFRCTGCWQPLRASIDSVGESVECRWCHQAIVVPEATENRIQRAVAEPEPELADETDEAVDPVEFQKEPLSREQIAAIAAQRAKANANSRACVSTPEAMPQAGRFIRLLASIVDSLILAFAAGAGVAVVVVLAGAGIVDLESGPPPESLSEVPWQAISVVLFFPLAVSFINWNLITTQGQTLAKKLFGIKIVDDTGDAPGFFRGVIVRNWMRNFLGSLIPFFGLIDALFIFSDPPRCVHDRMAGTYVVNVRT